MALIGLFGISILGPLAALAPAPESPIRAHSQHATSVPLARQSPDLAVHEFGLSVARGQLPDAAASGAGPDDPLARTTLQRGLTIDDAKFSEADDAGTVRATSDPARPTLTLLLGASQQAVALLGLAPQPGVAPPMPQPASGLATAPVKAAAQVTLALTSPNTGDAPGWMRQAAWTVALAAFGLLAIRGAGAAVLLFSRFDRQEVLAHDRRARLFEAIRVDPGVAFGRLQTVCGWAPGVVQHHLRLLEQHGIVRRVRDGRTTHFFPAGPRPAPTVSLAPARKGLLAILTQEPGMSLAALAVRRGHRAQSVWHHLDRLRTAGLVESRRDGRVLRWHIAPAQAG